MYFPYCEPREFSLIDVFSYPNTQSIALYGHKFNEAI